MYFSYYIVGGIYVTSRVSKYIKIAWFIFSMAFSIFVVLICEGGFFLVTEKIDPYTIISNFYGASCVVAITLIVPLITCHYHREFETLFVYIEDNQNSWIKNEETFEVQYIKKIDSLRETLFWSVIAFYSSLPATAIGLVDVSFFCDEEYTFRDLQHHSMGFPYLDRIPSMKVALLAYVAELIIFSIQFVIGLSQVNLTMMIATELNNIVVDYCRRIHTLDAFVSTDVWKSRGSFERKLGSLVRQYQTFVK